MSVCRTPLFPPRQDLLLYKDDGFKRVHAAVDLGHQVLRNTEPTGHRAISEQLSALQDSWSSMANRMAETKVRNFPAPAGLSAQNLSVFGWDQPDFVYTCILCRTCVGGWIYFLLFFAA